jgi:pyruvate/2-oxoglutarate/acetoin dehydrogenase E1 component
MIKERHSDLPETFLSSLNQALHLLFETDERVYLIGEDLLDPYGGAFKVSKGLSTRFPHRVLTTPISEGAIAGICAGMALRGLRPVGEIMFGDFITLCIDQIVNGISKFRPMFNNQVSVPMVLRTPMGGGRGYGPTHSQSIEKILLGIPHLKVVSPSIFHNPGALLINAVSRQEDPVIFVENKLLYPEKLIKFHGKGALVKVSEDDSLFPTVVLKNFESGNPDITIVSYGGSSRLINRVMEDLRGEEIRITACFMSHINTVPSECVYSAILESRRVLIVEEGTEGFNWGSEIAATIYLKLFNALEKPIKRLAAAPTVIPAAKGLEAEILPSVKSINQAIFELL